MTNGGGGRRGRGPLSALAWIGSAAMTAAGLALFAVFLLLVEANRPGPVGEGGAVVVIPRGASVTAIARALEEEGAVRSAIAFRVTNEIYDRGRGLKAGEYRIPEGASVRDIITLLASGRVLLHPIAVPEGWTSAMVVERLAASEVLDGPVPPVPPEGAILPDTYKVARGTDRTELLKKMVAAREALLEDLWAKRADGLPIKTPEEAVILASIVEKETGVASERPRVAAVFTNRLRRGMKLESDPTIIYGLTQGRPLGRGILRSELQRQTEYNTYFIPRLPPTPIANPGREALAAVLNPPKSDELFFVADGTGGHAFAATYAEHQRNVARWRQIEQARGQ